MYRYTLTTPTHAYKYMHIIYQYQCITWRWYDSRRTTHAKACSSKLVARALCGAIRLPTRKMLCTNESSENFSTVVPICCMQMDREYFWVFRMCAWGRERPKKAGQATCGPVCVCVCVFVCVCLQRQKKKKTAQNKTLAQNKTSAQVSQSQSLYSFFLIKINKN